MNYPSLSLGYSDILLLLDLFSFFFFPLCPSCHLFYPLPPEKQEIRSFPTNRVSYAQRFVTQHQCEQIEFHFL